MMGRGFFGGLLEIFGFLNLFGYVRCASQSVLGCRRNLTAEHAYCLTATCSHCFWRWHGTCPLLGNCSILLPVLGPTISPSKLRELLKCVDCAKQINGPVFSAVRRSDYHSTAGFPVLFTLLGSLLLGNPSQFICTKPQGTHSVNQSNTSKSQLRQACPPNAHLVAAAVAQE